MLLQGRAGSQAIPHGKRGPHAACRGGSCRGGVHAALLRSLPARLLLPRQVLYICWRCTPPAAAHATEGAASAATGPRRMTCAANGAPPRAVSRRIQLACFIICMHAGGGVMGQWGGGVESAGQRASSAACRRAKPGGLLSEWGRCSTAATWQCPLTSRAAASTLAAVSRRNAHGC